MSTKIRKLLSLACAISLLLTCVPLYTMADENLATQTDLQPAVPEVQAEPAATDVQEEPEIPDTPDEPAAEEENGETSDEPAAEDADREVLIAHDMAEQEWTVSGTIGADRQDYVIRLTTEKKEELYFTVQANEGIKITVSREGRDTETEFKQKEQENNDPEELPEFILKGYEVEEGSYLIRITGWSGAKFTFKAMTKAAWLENEAEKTTQEETPGETGEEENNDENNNEDNNTGDNNAEENDDPTELNKEAGEEAGNNEETGNNDETENDQEIFGDVEIEAEVLNGEGQDNESEQNEDNTGITEGTDNTDTTEPENEPEEIPVFEIDNNVLTRYNGEDETVIVPDGIVEIGSRAFYGNESIRTVVLPDSVGIINNAAFAECTNLTTVEISENSSLEIIGSGAFRNDIHLDASFAANVPNILNNAFEVTSESETEEQTDGEEETPAEEDTKENEEPEETTEESEDPEEKALQESPLVFEGRDFTVTVNFGEDAAFPQGIELNVREILPGTEEYRLYSGQTDEVLSENWDEVAEFARFFDITFVYNGEEIEPQAPIDVQMTFAEVISVTNDAADELQVQAIHFDKEEGAKVIESEAQSVEAAAEDDNAVDTVAFSSGSFSVYGFVQTAKITQNVITADGTNYRIDVTYEQDSEIPMNAELVVTEITSDDERYEEILNNSAETLGVANEKIKFARFFDIEILDANGLKTEPSVPVQVQIGYQDALQIGEQDKLSIVHFVDNENGSEAEVITNASINENATEISYEQGSFSITGTIITDNGGMPVTGNHDNPRRYAVIIRDPATDKYYAVQNEGSLVEVEYYQENGRAKVKFEYPIMWTYTSAHDGISDDTLRFNASDEHQNWDPYNLRISVDCRDYDNNQLPVGNYYRYISPCSDNGIDQEDKDTNPNHGTAKWHNVLKYDNTRHTIATTKWNGNTNVMQEGMYLGADFTTLHITGNNNSNDAAEVYFAELLEVPDYGANHEAVSHIDIAMKGTGYLDVPLAYGAYYDKNGNQILNVASGQNITLHLEQEVAIDKNDIMAASIEARDGNGNVVPEAYRVNGYTSNDSNPHTGVQVRIEGSFKVTTLPEYQGGNSNADSQRKAARLIKANQVFYTISTTKEVIFNLVYNGQQLYDKNNKPLTVTAKVRLSAGFSYWDEKNECPPLLEDFESQYHLYDNIGGKPDGYNYNAWREGAIIDNNWDPGDYCYRGDSGMDFRLGNQSDSSNKVVAVEIVKMIVSENGDRIYPAQGSDITNNYTIYYSESALPSSVHSLAISPETISSSTLNNNGYYTGYGVVRGAQTVVSDDGIGVTYDYDVKPGMVYIAEDSTSLQAGGVNHTITDANGNVWEYKETRIETEYVWRDNAYNGKRHVAEGYSAVPEVLGSYLSDNQEIYYNSFLEFYVYNVYTTTPTNLKVAKTWKPAGTDISGAEVTLELKRYMLVDTAEPPTTGSLFVSQRVKGDTEGTGFASTYTLQGNGQTYTGTYNSDIGGAFFNNLTPGDYTVSISSSVTNEDYLVTDQPAEQMVSITAGDSATVAFTTTVEKQHVEHPAIVYIHAQEEKDYIVDSNNDGQYVYKRYLEYPVGTWITVTFDNGNPDYNPYYGMEIWIHGENKGQISQTNNSFTFQVREQTVERGDNDICVLGTNESNWMNILAPSVMRFIPEGIDRSGPIITGEGTNGNNNGSKGPLRSARRGTVTIGATNTGTAPVTSETGKKYVVDETWSHTVTLKNGVWTADLDGAEIDGLVGFDVYGNNYLYFISSVSETGVPEGTVVTINNNADGSVLYAQNNTLTLTATNQAPGTAVISGTKSMEHGGNPANYRFDLTAVTENAPMPSSTETLSDSTGAFSFPEIVYPVTLFTATSGNPIAYEYKVTEYCASNDHISNGVRFDASDKIVTVTVTYNAESGTITTQVTPATDVHFVNEELGSLIINKEVYKNAEPDTEDTGMYYFGIYRNPYDPNAEEPEEPIVVSITVANGEGTETVQNLQYGTYYVYELTGENGTPITDGAGVFDGKYYTVTGSGNSGTVGNTAPEFTIRNEYCTVDIPVLKTWGDDQEPPEGAAVTLKLKASIPDGNGEETPVTLSSVGVSKETVTLDGNTENDTDETTAWQYTWTELPAKTTAGQDISYTVEETVYTINGETVSLTDYPATVTAGAPITVTNQIPKRTIKAKKNWPSTQTTLPVNTIVQLTIAAEVSEGADPISINPSVVELDGTEDSTETIAWEYEWTNLPKYDSKGSLIPYTVSETSYEINDISYGNAEADLPAAQGYDFSFTNPMPTVAVSATKAWEYADGTTMTTPPEGATVTFALYANENAFDPAREVVLDGSDDRTLDEETQQLVPQGNDYEGGAWTANFTNLPKYDTDGSLITYTVKETEDYPGYENENPDGVVSGRTIINKERTTDIHILKVDAENSSTPLTGAKFILKQYADDSYTGSATKIWEEQEVSSETGKEGTLTFEGLTVGYYELEETQSPDGYYRISTNPRFSVSIDEDGDLEVTFTDTSTVTYSATDNTFTIGNTPGAVLPITGGAGTWAYTVTGLVLTLAAGAFLLKGRKRRRE